MVWFWKRSLAPYPQEQNHPYALLMRGGETSVARVVGWWDRWSLSETAETGRDVRARALKISLVSVFAALAAGLAHASVASAATVTVRDRDGSPAIFYVAGPGERNDVSLRTDFASEGETTTISDSGAVITTSRRCRSIDAHTAVCPTQYVNRAYIAVGDLDDRVTPEDFYEDMVIVGGSGNDVLRGNDIGSDRLNGGGGQDQLYGGRGDVFSTSAMALTGSTAAAARTSSTVHGAMTR